MNDDQVEDLYQQGLRDIERYLKQIARLLKISAELKDYTIRVDGDPDLPKDWLARLFQMKSADRPDVPPTP